jgi:hypothetical protein
VLWRVKKHEFRDNLPWFCENAQHEWSNSGVTEYPRSPGSYTKMFSYFLSSAAGILSRKNNTYECIFNEN